MSSPPAQSSAPRRRLTLGFITIALVAIAFFGLLPALADYRHAWDVLLGVTLSWIGLVLTTAVLSQLLGPLPTMVVIPGLGLGQALGARMASTTAANTIPGGGAVGVGITYAMLGGWGHPGSAIGASVVLTGVWNTLTRMLLPALALVAASLSGIEMPSLVDGALIGVVSLLAAALLFLFALRGITDRLAAPIDRLVRWMGRAIKRPVSAGSPTRRFLDVVQGSFEGDWQRLAASTVLYHLSVFGVLLVSLRAVGVDPTEAHWAEILAAFALVRLASAIPITPGALGVVEVGLTGLLAAGLTDAQAGSIAAGVLLFRFVTYAMPTLAGAGVLVAWKRARSREKSPGRWGDYPAEHLESAVCFRCRVPGDLRWRLDQFALVDCPQCGQSFTSPRLNHEGRLALYGDAEYFDGGVYGTEGAKGLQRRWAKGRLDLIQKALGHQAGGTLFEIGCAYGMFLEAAQAKGFAVGGLEFSPVAAATATRRLGRRVHVGEIGDLPRSQHQVIAFWDVIEHVPDPGAFLGAVTGLVKPGGIVAFSCPRFDSLPAKLLGRRWWTLKPHKHIWHFTRSDLERLLSEHGLTLLHRVAHPFGAANLGRLDSVTIVARKPS